MRPTPHPILHCLLPLLVCAGCQTDTAPEPDPEPGALRLRFEELEVEGDFAMVTDFRFVPGTHEPDELIALRKDGRVLHYRLEGDRAVALGSFELPGVYSVLDCGLLGLAFDPEFATNRFIYFATCTSQTQSAIFRVTFDPSDYEAIASTAAEIIRVGDEAASKPWHNIGSIGFDDSGALWALFGDKRVAANGQDVSNDLSALVRIIPNRDPNGSGHEPAPGNAFVGSDGSPNVFAYGLRSPWRGVYDSKGRWWIGDVGSDAFEEINLVTEPGANFGWSVHEGPCEQPCESSGEPALAPVVSWPHDQITQYMSDDPDVRPTVARVAWVGLEYQPRSGPDPYDGRLTGAVLFGDYCLGFVRALEVDDEGNVTRDEPLGHLAVPSGWDRGPDGHVYATTFGSCETAGLDERDPPESKLVRAVPQR